MGMGLVLPCPQQAHDHEDQLCLASHTDNTSHTDRKARLESARSEFVINCLVLPGKHQTVDHVPESTLTGLTRVPPAPRATRAAAPRGRGWSRVSRGW